MHFSKSKNVLFEPRAYWDVGFFPPDEVNSNSNQSAREIVFNKDSFRNISRNPVQLTKLNLCVIGAAQQNTLNFLSQASFVLSAPNRQTWSFNPLNASTWKQDRKAEPSMLYSASPYASGLLGLSRWDFDHEFLLPRDGIIQFDVSGLSYASAEIDAGDLPNAYYTFAFFEKGGFFGGNARLRERKPIRSVPQSAGDFVWPRGNQPVYNLDYAIEGGVLLPSKTWAEEGSFKSKEWRQNEVTRGQMASAVSGFQVLVDQITSDDEAFAADATFRAPMSGRLICRARTTAGPSGEWWWREGAPLCLVSPNAGPAVTYTLPEPITLQPGDQLQLEMTTPRVYFNETAPFELQDYNVGVSFTGFAEVQG